MTPEARLAAAVLASGQLLVPTADEPRESRFTAKAILAADPTIAADLNDAPRLRAALENVWATYNSHLAIRLYIERNFPYLFAALEQCGTALTEGSGE